MYKFIIIFLAGMLLGSLLTQPALAQQAAIAFGVNAGVLKPLQVDASGNLVTVGH